MRRAVRILASVVAVVVLSCACGTRNSQRAGVGVAPIAAASCRQPPVARVPLPGQVGVYRAGPLLLVTGEDLAQVSEGQLARARGSEAIVVITAHRTVDLSVDPRSRARFSLQFTPLFPGHPSAVMSDGRAAVRFPPCGRTPHRFGGGILFARSGCVRLHVRPSGESPIPLLIPIGNTLRGCPTRAARKPLSLAAAPFLGVACSGNSIACDRVGIGVRLDRPATLVTVGLAGKLVTLSPPPDPPDDLWLGYLGNAGLRRGPLKVHVPKGQKLWFGTPVVAPRATVTAFFPNDTVGRLSTSSMLHPGFG